MKKFRKIAIIVVVVVGVLYGGYMLFINPSGYTDKTELTQDFFLDIHFLGIDEGSFGSVINTTISGINQIIQTKCW